jgi:hypothetical protein
MATGWFVTLTNAVAEATELALSASSTEAFTLSYSGKAVSAQITTT